MHRTPLRIALAVAVVGLLPTGATLAAEVGTIAVEYGPIVGAPNSSKTVSFDVAARKRTKVFDIQDGREHHVRGVPLVDLLKRTRFPKGVDTALFEFADGMVIPVRLRDKRETNALFIAFEHGDPMDNFEPTYKLLDRADVACPKVVYRRRVRDYSIWLYPTELQTIRFVTWKAYENKLAQPTRQMPDRSGFPLYVRHCSSCHGLGGQGANRAPDLLTMDDAYRRIPPMAVTDRSEHPSLHEKVKGLTPGVMPVLNHIPDRQIAKLWRWLHQIHRGATK